jgi:hypothetical protein
MIGRQVLVGYLARSAAPRSGRSSISSLDRAAAHSRATSGDGSSRESCDGDSEVDALVILLSVPINDGTVATTLALCDGVVHADVLRDGNRDADSEGVALEHDDAVGEYEFVAVALALSDGEPDVDLNIEADAQLLSVAAAVIRDREGDVVADMLCD